MDTNLEFSNPAIVVTPRSIIAYYPADTVGSAVMNRSDLSVFDMATNGTSTEGWITCYLSDSTYGGSYLSSEHEAILPRNLAEFDDHTILVAHMTWDIMKQDQTPELEIFLNTDGCMTKVTASTRSSIEVNKPTLPLYIGGDAGLLIASQISAGIEATQLGLVFHNLATLTRDCAPNVWVAPLTMRAFRDTMQNLQRSKV